MKNTDVKSVDLKLMAGVAAAVLCLSAAPSTMAQASWTGGASPDLNWSTGANWSGGTGGSGEPSASDAVVFGETGVVGDAATVNNIVDLSFGGMIASLTYNQANSGEYHVTEIPAGQTLNVTGDVTVGGLNADGSITEVIMTGGGTFAPAGTTFHVGNRGSSSTSSLQATLDMSGLSNFVYNVPGGTWVVAGSGGDARGGGVLNLAGESNDITVGTINFNTGSGNNSGFHSLIQFGAGTNILNVGTFNICQTKARFADVQFISTAPETAGLRLRGVDGNSDDTSRATITLGDRANSGSSDTIGRLLLNGHPVDIKADTLTVGQDRTSTSSTSTRSGQGVLEFDNGTVDANTVLMANLSGNSSSSTALGTVTVGTNGTLLVGSGGISLVRQDAGTASGDLEIDGGSVVSSGDIFKTTSAGTASIVINSGSLNAGGILGGSDAPIDSMDVSDATLTLTVGTSARANVTTLTCDGTTNIINVANVPTVTGYPTEFPLIAYSGSLGGSFNFGVGTFPVSSPAFTGYITNNTADNTIDLVVTGGPAPARQLTWDGVPTGDWDTTTANWKFSGASTTYSSGDFVLFDDSASGTTTVNLTGAMTPSGITVSNETKAYGFAGSGNISGDTGIIKQGAGALYITNNNVNDNTGSLRIEAGTVQVGDGGYSGYLSTGDVMDDGSLVFNRADAITWPNTISGSGSLSKMGDGSLELTGGNSYDGATLVQKGTLKTSNGSALGSTVGATTVNSGATLDVNGSNLGAEVVNVSGAGDGNGVIVNSGSDQTHALQYVTLLADATIGGSGRWDIRSPSSHDPTQASLSTGGQPLNLTKIGYNQVSLVAVDVDSKLANVDVQQGTFGIETETTGLGDPSATLTVEQGATLELYQMTNQLDKVIHLDSDGFTDTILNNSGANTIVGPVTLLNTCTFNVNGTSLALNGDLSGSGMYVIKNGTGNLIIGGSATEEGITANLGQLTLNGTHTGSITCSYLITPVAFAGTGTNYGNTDLSGTLFPGDTNVVGTITLGDLTLEYGATVGFDLGPDNSVGGTNNDLIQVNGDLTINGNAVMINPMGVLQLGVPYRFANYTGNLIWNGDLMVAGPNGQYIFTVDTNTPGQVNLIAAGGPPVWNGGSASNNNWSDADNWSGVALNPGNSVIFAGTTRLNNTNDTADATSYNGITFDPSAGAFVLNGNSITLAGAIANNSTNDQTINLALNIGSDLTLDGGSGSLNLANNVTNTASSGTQTMTLAGNGSLIDLITNTTGGRLTFLTTSNANWSLLDNAASNAVSFEGELNLYNGGSFTFGSTNGAPNVTLVGSDGTGSQRNLIGNDTGTSVMNMISGNLTMQTRLNIGNGPAGAALNISGGTINVESSSISIADNGATTVGTVTISGGTLNTGPADNPSAHTFFVATRGTGTLTLSGTGQLVCGTLDVSRNASSASSTGVVNLDGGTITASRVSSGTSATGSSGTPTATFNFNGGTLMAGASSSTWFQGRGSSPAIPVDSFVKSGGAVIDTAGNDVSVLEPLQHDSALGGTPDGGLTKLGDGTLTLSATNSYTGDTTVNGGTLEIALATLATNSTVSVASGAMLQLDFAGTNQVATLVLDGVSQPAGIYDATTSPGFIFGTGSLVVGSGPAPQLTITGINVSGTTLNITAVNGTANGQFILLGTTNVALPLSSWTPVLTNNFDNSGSLDLSTNIVDPNVPQEFYILMQ